MPSLKKRAFSGLNRFKRVAKKKLGEAPVKPKKKPAGNTDASGKSTRISMNKKTSPTPTKKPQTPAKKSTGVSDTRKRFNKAFAAARKSGKKEFTFEGKRFNTKLKGE